MNKSILFFLFLFLSASVLLAQTDTGTIQGTVTDNENNPIPGLNVALEGTTLGNITDVDGTYMITNIPTGPYQLIVSGVGYQTLERSVEITGGQATQLDFTLQTSLMQLQEVEIMGRKETTYQNEVSFVASKTATPLQDIPQAISYVTKEVMADRQAYRVNDVVKNISGINQFSYYNDYTIRGFRSQQELINGLRVIGLFGPQIITANLERVEIIKGPASAMFGNASPGGTMNRVTKKPLDEDRKAITFTTGSFNTLRSTLDFTGPLNEDKTLLYRLNLAYENSNDFRDLQEFRSFMVAPSITFLPTDNTSINFDLVITNYDGKLDRGQPIFGASAGTDLTTTPISFAIGAPNDYHESNEYYSTLSVNHRFTDKISFNASYMRFSIREDLFEHRTSNRFAVDSLGQQIPTLMGMRISAREGEQTSDNVTTYFVFDAETGPIEHKILVGYDFIQQVQPVGNGSIFTSSNAIYRTQDGGLAVYDPENPQNFFFDENGNPVPNIPHFNLEDPNYVLGYPSDYILGRAEVSATRFFSQGVYVQDQLKWNRWQMLLGLRQEFYVDVTNYKQPGEEEVQQDKLLPRIGLVYGLTDQINLYGTYVESFQPQNPANLVEAQGGPFDPMIGEMIEFGAKGQFWDNRLAITLAAYDIENQNILITDPNTGLLVQRGGEEAQGIELDVNGQVLPGLSLSANYAYSEARITESDNEELIGEFKENAPRHSGGFFAKYAFGNGALSGLNVNIGANFVTERNTFEQALQLPGYTVFDAGVAYRVNKVNMAFTLNNVFDKTHWVGGYSFVRLFPGAPRNFLLSVGYTF
ncbi:MAG: TonB-dependent receptor [Bacteroidota bacterium]